MKDIRNLLLIFFLALVNGLIYVFLVPPWQHYDEPNHFEYVWMAANLNHLPSPEDYNPKISRQVLKSMIANGFFDRMDTTPVISPPSDKVRIPGYRQLKEPPLYYMFASLPVRLLHSRGVDAQLYATRLASFLFYLITVFITWGIAREISSQNHPLRWMLPLTVALLPGFTDLMTAVNNDVLAVTVFSLFLWGSVRLIKNGLSLTDIMLVIGTAVLAFFSKNTALITWLLLPLVFLLTVFRGKLRWLAWSILIGVLVIGFILCVTWEDAAFWYRANSQVEPTRLADDKAVLGDYVLQLDSQAEVTPRWLDPLFQPIPTDEAQGLRGKTVTLGVWIWTSNQSELPMPSINTPSISLFQLVPVSNHPKFYAIQIELPQDAIRTWVSIPNPLEDSNGWIFYDGFVLAEGKYPVDQIPSFSTLDGKQGEWGGRPFVNLLRNSSFEKAGPRVIQLLDDFSTKVLPDHTRLSLILTSLFDWSATGYLYQLSIRHLFQTFWARFGWGHVPLIGGDFSYWILASFTIIAGIGCVVGLIWRKFSIRNIDSVDGNLIGFMGVGLSAAWGMTLVRGANSLGMQHQYIPVARHAYPVIIPTLVFLCLGWLVVFHVMNYFNQRWRNRKMEENEVLFPEAHSSNVSTYQKIFFSLLLITLDLASMISIAYFYNKI